MAISSEAKLMAWTRQPRSAFRKSGVLGGGSWRDAHNAISGGIFHGPVWQGRDNNGQLPGTGAGEDRATRREGDGGVPPR